MNNKEKLPEATSWPEWVVAALGAALIVTIIGYMIFFTSAHPPSPPDVTVLQTSKVRVSQGYLVEFVARNEGNSTAANLVVKGVLTDGDRVVEESETTLDYVPQQAERKGGLFFRNDPSMHTVELQAGGYVDP